MRHARVGERSGWDDMGMGRACVAARQCYGNVGNVVVTYLEYRENRVSCLASVLSSGRWVNIVLSL